MLKKIILTILLFVQTSVLLSQNNQSENKEYKVSKPYKVFDFDNNYYVTKDKEILIIKFIRNHCVLQRFDTSLPELIKENRFLDFFPNTFKVEDFKEIAGKYFFFYSVNKNKNDEIYSQEVDFETAGFINQPKLILTTKGSVNYIDQSSYLHVNRTEKKKFEFIQPKDKSKLLIKYTTKLDDEKANSIILNLFNIDLSFSCSKSISIDIKKKKNEILSNVIDNQGNYFFVTKKYNEEKELNYDILINVLENDSKKTVSRKLETDNKYLNEMSLSEFDGNIICGSFTNNSENTKVHQFLKKSTLNNSNGLLIFKLNKEGETLSKKYFEFPDDVIKFYKNQDKIDCVGNLYIHDFEVTQKGEILLIGEQYSDDQLAYSFEGANKDAGIYSDIIICKINELDKLDFIKRIAKVQVSQNESQPYSFVTFFSGDYAYFSYTDNFKNFEASNTKLNSAKRDLILSRVSLINGDVSKRFLFDMSNFNGMKFYKFSINRFYKSNLNSFCFDVYKKDKEDLMIKIDF